MKSFSVIAGVDVSKLDLDICYQVGDRQEHFKCSNDAKGLSDLFKRLTSLEKNRSKILVCCEHTGVYMDKLATVLNGEGIMLWAVHPLLIKNFGLDLSRLKNDKADARKILSYAVTHQTKAIAYQHPEASIKILKELFLLSKQLISLRQQTSNFISTEGEKVHVNPFCSSIYSQLKSFLNVLIKEVQKEINRFTKANMQIREQLRILNSIPGIGPVISNHMLIVSSQFERFTSYKQMACYIGIAPFEKSSGSSVRYKARTSKKAYQPLKADLHEGVISVIRKGQMFHDYYQAMRKLNRPHLWIMNTIMNILVKLAFTLIRKKQLFDKQLFISRKKSWENLAMS